jgi:hypothetical protein
VTSTDTHILDLAKQAEPPTDGMFRKTLSPDDQIKAVVFGFAASES